MYIEFLFTQNNYFANNSFKISPYNESQYLDISLSSIKLPIGFRYIFSGKRSGTVYSNIGIVYYSHRKKESYRAVDRKLDNGIDSFERGGAIFKSSEFGVWTGVGINKNVSKKINGFLELRYEISEGFVSDAFDTTGGVDNNLGLQHRNHFYLAFGVQLK